MTAKSTGKRDVADDTSAVGEDAEDVAAVRDETADTADTEEAAAPKGTASPRPARARRVRRVIEVVEDDDDEPDDEPGGEASGEAGDASQSARRERAAGRFSRPVVTLAVLVVALTGLAAWQWYHAAGLAAKEEARREVSKVAGAYGDVVFTYNAATVQDSVNKNLALLGGEERDRFQRGTAKNLPNFFATNPKWVLTSKTKKVYVADIGDDTATAVILLDVTLRTAEGSTPANDTLLRTSLAKFNGAWKITQTRVSGQSDNDPSGSQIPGLPGTGGSGTPSPSATPGRN